MLFYLLPGSVVPVTPASSTLYESSITGLSLLGCGKVCENYAVGGGKLLMVTTDHLSASGVILGQPIPDKGRVLVQMSDFWLNELRHTVPTHETGIAPETVVAPDEVDQVRGRAIVAKRLKPIPVEATVRGYLVGSGWRDYQTTGVVCGVHLAPGLQSVQKLPELIFIPTVGVEMSEHDKNTSFNEVGRRAGPNLAAQVRDVDTRLYKEASDFAATRGVIIAGTKLEFGPDGNGMLILMNEALTADPSCFWPIDSCRVGTSPPSFGKQFVRDWFETVRIDGKPWPRTMPAPWLPTDVIEKTADKYREALARLTSESLR